jgi:hypothetical protein
MWHALALSAVVLVDAWRPTSGPASYLSEPGTGWPVLAAGWLFVAASRCSPAASTRWRSRTAGRGGAVTPFGGVCLLLGWALLAFAIVVK